LVLVRVLELLAGSLLLIAMYWAPTLVAFGRRAEHWIFIAILNSLLGWTIVGWLAALLWSVLAAADQQDDVAPPVIASDPELPVAQAISPADPLIAH
jgi:hypothetical protein